MKHFQFVVNVPQCEGMSKQDARRLVRAAIQSCGDWTGQRISVKPADPGSQGGALAALRALYANMLAQDLQIQAERPTEAEYLGCMEAARVAIEATARKGSAA